MDLEQPKWILVPMHLLDELEFKIKTVKENLEQKQKTLMQVISQQQVVIKNQLEKLSKYEKILSGNSRFGEADNCRDESILCSPDDSGLDADIADCVSDDSKYQSKCEADNEDTDSYITLSDSSEIMSPEVGSQSQQETYQLSYKPILMEVYQNNHRNILDRNKPARSCENKTKRNFMKMKSLNNESFKAIGSPESLTSHQTEKSRINVLQKSVRLFKRSKDNKSNIVKCKSEGNIKELIDKEPKFSLMQSLYKGFSSMNLRYSEQKHYTSAKPSCYNSLGPEISTLTFNDEVGILGDNQKAVSNLRRQESQMNSLPITYSAESDTSIFSCFAAGHRAMMPNHRNVMRPRDIKNKNLRKSQIFV